MSDEQKLAAAHGWKSVPVIPDQAMCQAGQDEARKWPRFPIRIAPIWQAMLSAAPVSGKECGCSNAEGEICTVCDPIRGYAECSSDEIDEWELFARWTKTQGHYSLISAAYAGVVETDGGTPLPTFLQDATEHAWRGWIHGRRAVQRDAAQQPRSECALTPAEILSIFSEWASLIDGKLHIESAVGFANELFAAAQPA